MSRSPKLFEKPSFRSVTLRNRIVVSPMCQYSATEGVADLWHLQHLGSRAAGGAGLVFTEATHVSRLGRISAGCLGLWNDEQQAALKQLVQVIERGGAVPGMQISHSGRKGSSARPWDGGGPISPEHGGWVPWAPSAIPFTEGGIAPHAMSVADIQTVLSEFRESTRRAREAGIKVIEVHAAHGYLIHSFLSPIANIRRDEYGGDLTGRIRFLMEAVDVIRSEWPDDLPLFVRLSCTDWMPGGLTGEDAVLIATMLKATGKVDLIDCSTGGVLAHGPVIPALYSGYQVPYSEAVRLGAGMPTGAVGLISSPEHAEEIVANGRADLVFLARALLVDPYWPLHAAATLKAPMDIPPQYARAAWK